MKISNNIIKHHLSHVYWVLGTGCAGKTTLCKHLSENYDMHYYDSDTKAIEHFSISDARYQPAMNIDKSDWNKYFNRSPKEYAKSLRDSISEQFGFIIADLLSLPKNKPIILDGHFYPDEIIDIAQYNHILYLTSSADIANKQFFDRDDKNDLYQLIMSLDNSEKIFENLFTTFNLMHNVAFEKIINSGFNYYIRKEDTRIDSLATYAINHFEL